MQMHNLLISNTKLNEVARSRPASKSTKSKSNVEVVSIGNELEWSRLEIHQNIFLRPQNQFEAVFDIVDGLVAFDIKTSQKIGHDQLQF